MRIQLDNTPETKQDGAKAASCLRFDKFYNFGKVVFPAVHVDGERPIRRQRPAPLIVQALELIHVHEVQIVLILAPALSHVFENRLNRAVEIDKLVNLRHQRIDAGRELLKRVKFRLREVSLVQPVARDDEVLQKAPVEEEQLSGFHAGSSKYSDKKLTCAWKVQRLESA